jgi:RNA polymerase sigma-70 factor (ECF subfamily)
LRASLRPLATRVDAEAIVQETLLRVWQVIPGFTRDDRPNGLLRFALRCPAILRWTNCAASALTRPTWKGSKGRFQAVGEVTEPIEPDPLLRRLLDECRQRLPDQPARALAMRLENGTQPDRALAVSLGMQLNTFLQNISRARRLLMECLEERGVNVVEELR